jgi:hypothetical protein
MASLQEEVSISQVSNQGQQTSKSSKKKQAVEDILLLLPDTKNINFELLELPPFRPAETCLEEGIDFNNPLNIFQLFIPDSLFEVIARNTNNYAIACRIGNYPNPVWTNTTVNELKVFFGVILYMGMHKSPSTLDYWNRNATKGPLHTVRTVISQSRWHELKQYLHILQIELSRDIISQQIDREITEAQTLIWDEESLTKNWWYKVKPLLKQLRRTSEFIWKPSSNISIDKVMIHCFGQSSHTVKMPHKPIKQGYKIFAAAD